jgi:hypothetical protein
VEVKGDPPKSAANLNSGREVRFIQSVGQLITRIHPERGYYYGLAYPSSYRNLVTRRLYPALLKKLKIHLFFVDSKLNVEHLTWRELEVGVSSAEESGHSPSTSGVGVV